MECDLFCIIPPYSRQRNRCMSILHHKQCLAVYIVYCLQKYVHKNGTQSNRSLAYWFDNLDQSLFYPLRFHIIKKSKLGHGPIFFILMHVPSVNCTLFISSIKSFFVIFYQMWLRALPFKQMFKWLGITFTFQSLLLQLLYSGIYNGHIFFFLISWFLSKYVTLWK